MNIVYDYETLNTDVTITPILSLATLRYDEKRFNTTPYDFDELLSETKFFKFDVTEQVKMYDRVINLETLAWWNGQPAALQKSQLHPNKELDLSVKSLIGLIKNEAKGCDRIFTRGNTFDPMITTSWVKQLGYPEPYQHWAVRDTRSFIEGLSYGSDIKHTFTPDGLGDKFVPHDPQHDIVVDVLRMQQIIRAIS